jgi:hypothetical protein
MRKSLNIKFDKNFFHIVDSDGGMFVTFIRNIASLALDETLEPYGVVAGELGSVRIYNASIQHSSFRILPSGVRYTDIQVLGGTLAVPHFVCAKYSRLSSLEVVSPAFSTIPINSVEYFYYPICAVYLDANGLSKIAYRLIRSMPIFPGEL